ncbi:unnamed protein product [Nezara viridula]|uniref:Uncharacterized protein n=1 Tax=Nezara viridula TaxID=85310 RepID=A0A9P0HI07_NEZVI|nr:unnamed protein product [Nezara viridula]
MVHRKPQPHTSRTWVDSMGRSHLNAGLPEWPFAAVRYMQIQIRSF